jgi:glycosyltransferase involved in cell wall biosynthesis
MLTHQISFCWLYDSGANNSILESIASGSPVVVNRLPAVEEYLGEDYPLYFENVKEDPEMFLQDEEILTRAVRYLNQRAKLYTYERFLKFFQDLNLKDLE